MLQQDQKLSIVSASFLGNGVIIRCNVIDTLEKAKELDSFLRTLPLKSDRVSSLQLNSPEHEWGLIQAQHRFLAKLRIPAAHLVFPLDQPIVPDIPKSELSMRSTIKICRLLNTEGWLIYSNWLNQDVEALLKTFKPEALDEYQLQAILEDLGHECRSVFLNDCLETLKVLQKRMEADDSFQLEKEAVWIREQLKRFLKTHYTIFCSIVLGIDSIKESHPELLELREKVFLLKLLVGSELDELSLDLMQKIMILQLLDQNLRVITCLNCDSGRERACFGFSIRSAIANIKSKDLVDTILHWKDCVKHANLGIKNEIVSLFQRDFLEMLGETLLPLKISKGFVLNSDLLYLLPQSLIEYNPKTGEPVSFKPTAYRTLIH